MFCLLVSMNNNKVLVNKKMKGNWTDNSKRRKCIQFKKIIVSTIHQKHINKNNTGDSDNHKNQRNINTKTQVR